MEEFDYVDILRLMKGNSATEGSGDLLPNKTCTTELNFLGPPWPFLFAVPSGLSHKDLLTSHLAYNSALTPQSPLTQGTQASRVIQALTSG